MLPAAGTGLKAMARPLSPDAQALLARAAGCFEQAALDEARLLISAVLARAPRAPEALFLQGELQRHEGKPDAALRSYRKALQAGMRSAALHVACGLAERTRGDGDAARLCFERALALEPASIEAHGNLARLHADTGALERGRYHGLRALELAPHNPILRANLAALHLRAQDTEAAWRCLCEQAPAGFELPRALLLGLCDQLLRAAAHERACALYRTLLARDPSDPEALNGLGLALYMQGDFDAAQAVFERLVAAQEDDPRGHYALGAGYRLRGAHAAAAAALGRALSLLEAQGAAREEYQRVVLELAFNALAADDFEQGWRHYAGRWYTHEPNPETALAERLWRGEPLGARRLVIAREQGVGDEIMFASMYAELRGLAGRVAVQCSSRLVEAFSRSFEGMDWWPCVERPESWTALLPQLAPDDVVAFAGSLPRWLRRSRTDFSGAAFLRPDNAARERWRARLADLGPGPFIGISWRGGTAANFRGLRSIPLAQLLGTLREVLPAGCVLVDLQYDDHGEEVAACVCELGLDIARFDVTRTDFAATLDLVAALDHVISVQTAVAHAAGALGVPTEVLVPLAPTTVRWLPAHGRSAWYRSVRLHQQDTPGEWRSALDSLARTLRGAGMADSSGGPG